VPSELRSIFIKSGKIERYERSRFIKVARSKEIQRILNYGNRKKSHMHANTLSHSLTLFHPKGFSK
jgi:hypothetical protein